VSDCDYNEEGWEQVKDDTIPPYQKRCRKKVKTHPISAGDVGDGSVYDEEGTNVYEKIIDDKGNSIKQNGYYIPTYGTGANTKKYTGKFPPNGESAILKSSSYSSQITEGKDHNKIAINRDGTFNLTGSLVVFKEYPVNAFKKSKKSRGKKSRTKKSKGKNVIKKSKRKGYKKINKSN